MIGFLVPEIHRNSLFCRCISSVFFARLLRARKYKISLPEFRRVQIRLFFFFLRRGILFFSACTSSAKVQIISLPEFRRVRHDVLCMYSSLYGSTCTLLYSMCTLRVLCSRGFGCDARPEYNCRDAYFMYSVCILSSPHSCQSTTGVHLSTLEYIRPRRST
jgi:hypothetical protein